MQSVIVDRRKTSIDRINLTSLNVVREELLITIEQAATQLEGFVNDRENVKLLDECIKALRQIRGGLQVIELRGAIELATELLNTASMIREDSSRLGDARLSVLTKGFFILSCYFEYALQKEYGMPALLLTYINEIRISNHEPIFWESHFVDSKTDFRVKPSQKSETIPDGDTISAVARRLRHMYQIGLLGLIKNLRISDSLELMLRAVTKMNKYAAGSNSETFWWLFTYTLKAFGRANLEFTVERIRLLSHLDREFKKVEKQGDSAFEVLASDVYLKEMAYYVALAAIDEPPYADIVQNYGFSNLGYDEKSRIMETRALMGPSVSAVNSVTETLRGELRTVKEMVEFLSVSESDIMDNVDELIESVTKIRDILGVVGLDSASESMNQQLKTFRSWRNTQEQLDAMELMGIADTFIYVESVLSSIEKGNLSDQKRSQINELSHREMIVKNQLVDAQVVVLEEASAGLLLVKRALNSFAESEFDRVHIKNITKTLKSVRGGLLALNLNRASQAIESCAKFIDQALLSTVQPAALEHMLETFADAIISIEYYLNCVKVDKFTNDDTLIVAEESLQALGYGVTYSKNA